MYTHAHMHPYTHTHVYTHIHIYAHAHGYTHRVHTRAHTRTHAHKQTTHMDTHITTLQNVHIESKTDSGMFLCQQAGVDILSPGTIQTPRAKYQWITIPSNQTDLRYFCGDPRVMVNGRCSAEERFR